MSLREIELKPAYDSEDDDILNSFYIPALSQSIKYRRLTGFFSSTSFAVAARGIASLVSNDGHMQLVVGVKLRGKDVDAINKGLKNPEEVISSLMIDDLDSIEAGLIRDNVKALAWMVANKCLEIKVAIVLDRKGNALDEETISKRGIFHQKVGILEDPEGNIVSFSGSVNETGTAWKENIEEFKVFRSWETGEVQHLNADHRKFEKYWHGKTKYVKVLDIPQAVRQKLIKIAPKNFDELKLVNKELKKKIKLREYQLEAVKNWLDNDKKGLFEMATATGKTYTALACVRELEKENSSLAIVIVCPFQHLIEDPWKRSIQTFGFKNAPIVTVFGGVKTWVNKLANEVLDLNRNFSNRLFVISTYDAFYSKSFIEQITKIKAPILLIADEVHSVGSEERRKGLIDRYSYRLGLSATPRRWLDDEGTGIIDDYFDKTVFEFPLDKAITSINPDTGETYLAPYEYYPHFIELNQQEFEEYERISGRIATEYHQLKSSEEKQRLYELLLFKRSNILKNAEGKFVEFERILNSIDNLDHCLVYCSSSRQMEIAQDMLNSRGIINHRFTQSESPNEREKLLKNFDEGRYQVLVAMKCLDEGVDVPSTKIAIILASSGNPREYIQRRGRILRRFPGKNRAMIHDILVIPTLGGNIPKESFELEQKILKKELKRYKEFARTSMNELQSFNKILPILEKYKIALEE